MKAFVDLATLQEAERIRIIGERARWQVVGVALENEAAKIARYIACVLEQFPDVRHIGTFPGLVKNTVLVQFGPPAKH